jgi:hypothetical protein
MSLIWNFGDLLCNSLSDDFSSITNEKVSFNKSCLDNIKIEDFYKIIETKDEYETFFIILILNTTDFVFNLIIILENHF